MKHSFIFLVIGITFNACSQNTPLTNTKWECKIADNCINFYDFKTDSTFIFYSCEMEDTLYGDYFFKNDTLNLDEKGSIYDNVYKQDSPHRVGRRLYKVVIRDNKIKHLYFDEWTNGKWVKSDFKLPEKLLYEKVK
jgi:hypothetical protein